MSVSFECVTRSGRSAAELFDLARDIDAHLGSQADAGGSVMIDRIRFEAPFGPLGRLVERVLLERYLRRLIEERGRYLAAGG